MKMIGKLQKVGAFLAAMVTPNIGAFIAWGLITALFIPSGWIPNAHLARLVAPMSLALLPILIGFSGGRLVYGIRGGVVGAVATMGVVAGSEVPMFVGAMLVGPLGGWLIKRWDSLVERRVPAGFEMLVRNFSAGVLGMGMALASFTVVGPLALKVTTLLGGGAARITKAGLLPLVALLIEPGKVMFANNAINHGVLSPLGMAQVKEAGRSIFFLLETNPGPGLGLLLAYWLCGKGVAKHSSPGAILIHFFGGIHEIYFPYALMNPLTLVALMAGGIAANSVFVATHAGLAGVPSPGSILAEIAMAPRGGLIPVLAGIAVGALVSCIVAIPIVRRSPADQSDTDSAEAGAASLASAGASPASNPASAPGGAVAQGPPAIVFFVCEAGMGSSVMGAAILKRKMQQAGLDVEVRHCALGELSPSAGVVISHQSLSARIRSVAPGAALYAVEDFINSPVYDQLVLQLSASAPKQGEGHAHRAGR